MHAVIILLTVIGIVILIYPGFPVFRSRSGPPETRYRITKNCDSYRVEQLFHVLGWMHVGYGLHTSYAAAESTMKYLIKKEKAGRKWEVVDKE